MAIPIILDCEPGHDDAIALLRALASPTVELLGVLTTYGNQTLEKTTANALRVLELVGRTDVPVAPGADRPLVRETRRRRPRPRRERSRRPHAPAAGTAPVALDAVSFFAERVQSAGRPVTLVPTGGAP